MKKLLLPAFVATIFATSCSSTNYPTDPNSYPYPNGKSYPPQTPYPDRRNPNEDVVVDRQGRVITRDGRVIENARNLPPGQAKKIYGSKSAKVYAPGQRKKVGRQDQYGKYPEQVYKEDKKQNKKKVNKGKGHGKGKR